MGFVQFFLRLKMNFLMESNRESNKNLIYVTECSEDLGENGTASPKIRIRSMRELLRPGLVSSLDNGKSDAKEDNENGEINDDSSSDDGWELEFRNFVRNNSGPNGNFEEITAALELEGAPVGEETDAGNDKLGVSGL